ncbi:MAG: bifunctional glycosyltransferase family 2/GtrA family protein [Mogibacterium sp.]|nr:bifunctional glycosyltransferase family 2/GtrA family protein [Mogibacterium sp.]
MTSRYIALIPAYEPDRNMLGVIADLGKKGFDVVVVDDGSGHEYAELFEQAAERLPGKTGKGVRLLIHDKNRGKGTALKTGLDFIGNFMVIRGEEKKTVIVTVDADGQHLAGDALKTACMASRNPGTLVLGSRNFDRQNASGNDAHREQSSVCDYNKASEAVPWKSRFGNTVTRKVFALATGTEIYDTQTGLRAFTADMIPDLLRIKGDRYEYEINMLMELAGKGVRIEEVPIETVYLNGNSASHFNTVKDSFRIYREILSYMTSGRALFQAVKFSAASFASFLIDYAVYALLLIIGPGLIFANIGARVVSSAVNFTLNRRVVFKSEKSALRSAAEYFALAAFILAGNTLVLQTLTGTLGFGAMAAKIMTEILFFMISWTVQKYVIFYTRQDNETEDAGKAGISDRFEAGIPDRFLVEYAAARPKKLKGVYRRRNNS